MSTYPVVSIPYYGSLLATNLFSSSTTLLLSAFGSSTSGTLVDDGTRLYVGEPVTMNGQDFIMLGSGTAQPGINLLGLTVPTGFAKDLILLQNAVTGALVFVFPDGVPNALGMIALVVDLDPVGYDFTSNGPICFASGTMILTEQGYRPVEALQPGEMLVSPMGAPLRLVANLRPQTDWISPSALLPVVIRENALAEGRPFQDLRVSQQHRIAVSGGRLELLFGLKAALAPALGLVNFDTVVIGHGTRDFAYHHLLCDRHGIILANGVATETLLWSDEVQRLVEAPSQVSLTELDQPYQKEAQPCLPQLSVREVRLLGRKAARPAAVLGQIVEAVRADQVLG